MQHGVRHRVRLRWGPALVATTAFAVAAASPGVAVALPGAPDRAEREFASSFEPGEPAPDWLNTVDTAPGGKKRASGVESGSKGAEDGASMTFRSTRTSTGSCATGRLPDKKVSQTWKHVASTNAASVNATVWPGSWYQYRVRSGSGEWQYGTSSVRKS